MRPSDMKTTLALPLTALAVVLCGCATHSSTPSTGGTTPGPATTYASAAPTTTSAGATESPPSVAASTATTAAPTATTAALTYTGPMTTKQVHAQKTVTGTVLQRLEADLAALKPVGTTMQCNVETGESATITLTTGGHTFVYTIPGSPCRGVLLTKDGVRQPALAGSTTLVAQVRAIAGFTGMAHPLTG